MVKFNKLQAAVSVLALGVGLAHAAVTLPALNIDKTQITTSGLSSGGFMANQMGIAYSSTFSGVGVFAAGPYWCAGGVNYTSCMYNASITQSILTNAQAKIDAWSGTTIDAKSNIPNQKVFIFVGSSDTTVGPNPVAALNTQYNNLGVPAASKKYVVQSGVAHVFPTDFDSTGNNSCSSAASPFISNCSYDGAKAVLEHFYGTLNARNNAPAAANYIEFDQTPYTSANPGMASTGWAYVPASCASGTQCKLHVAFHGCQQSTDKIGDKFVKNTGYTRWADTNNIVVLFPQTKIDNTSRQTAASGSLANPNACWDWIGWYGSNFAQNTGVQMKAVKAMVDKVSSGSTGGGGGGGGGGTTLPAPANVTASGATNTSMVIAWGSVSGAASYNVYRNGTKANASAIAGTSYTDSGLTAATTYSWTVKAVDSSGVEGTASSAVSATTTGTVATCTTASNYAHTTAGRAYQSLGIAYANGSNQSMGLWNTFTTTTLKQTGPNYYVVGTCP
ncbi:PHB depolymerase family esterase [Curvibacter sp. APW13]|uniref:extracellular catalytic domain type 2 short-chain-length polyhydroxyalkanoate depolymerase n=1 Tax=Curvibacter sp. APW13 TaxID=3077236 RepID=UPI0028DDE2DF|nr:PHB depolymerase family esterase [Curvibacter sp. APW13]MDT8991451.1 PHB depolymerase family esterase [Curvibacter sp. APW13]